MNASEPTTAYLFVHFTGLEQSETDEQFYFALSRDGRHWRDLREAGVRMTVRPRTAPPAW